MQEKIEQADIRFRNGWLLMNLGWVLVSVCTLTLATYSALEQYPGYLHEWRGLAILCLDLLILALYCSLVLHGTRRGHAFKQWPPPLSTSILYSSSTYIAVTLLALINNSFVWAYFIVLGLCFGLFKTRIVVTAAVIIFLSHAWFSSYLTWPLTGDNIGAMLSIGLTFMSLVIVCLSMQHLISERFERTMLLNEVAHSKEELEAAHQRLSETAIQEQELAVLRERTRLAREMHDTLGHALVLISVKLEAAQRLRSRDPQRCDQELEATKEIVRNSMHELRASIANLRSPALEREPACRALSRYAREMAQRSGLRISYDLGSDIEGLPEQIEETLWKIGQEALTNVEKHAQAQNVLLQINRQDGQIWLRIEDDGIGLSSNLCQKQTADKTTYESPQGHYGLSGMLERARQASGQLTVTSGSGNGTAIEVALPLVKAPSTAS